MAESDQRSNIISDFITGSFSLVIASIMTLLGSLFFSIIVEWGGIYYQWWPELPGHLHAKYGLEKELSWLHNDFKNYVIPPIQVATAFVEFSYQYLVAMTGLEWIILKFQNTVFFEYLMSANYVIQLNFTRIAVILMSMPAVALFVIYALVDGLTERDLRTWGIGIETSFVYHHAKSIRLPIVYLGVFLYLSIPVSLHPSFFMLPFAYLLALAIWYQATYFKKYT